MSNPQALRDRIRRLPIPQKDIAASAGVHEDTMSRFMRGSHDQLTGTLRKIETGVALEEEKLRAVLGEREPGAAA